MSIHLNNNFTDVTNSTIQNSHDTNQNRHKNRIKNLSSPEALVSYALNSLSEHPAYFHDVEERFIKELHEYTKEVIRDSNKLAGKDLEDISEIIGSDFLDASYEMNQQMFSAGLKFGALMIAQILF